MNDSTAPSAPNRLPVVGHAPAFARETFAALERWAGHGSIVRLEFPGETFYLVSDPAIVATVLRDGERRFTVAEQQRRAFADVEDRAVSTTAGDRWRRLRAALRPAFTRDAVERCAEGMVERTIARIETWDDGEVIDLHREMRLLTLEILAETLLDIDIRGDEDAVLAATDALVARSDPRRPGAVLPAWVPTPTDRRFRRAVRDLESVVERALEAPRGESQPRPGLASDEAGSSPSSISTVTDCQFPSPALEPDYLLLNFPERTEQDLKYWSNYG